MARFFHARHGRTHCPGGSDPIPCLGVTTWRGRISEPSIQTITSDELIKWRTAENMNAAIYTESTPDGNGDFTAVNIWRPGTYSLTASYSYLFDIPDGTPWWIAVQDQWDSPNTLVLGHQTGWHQLGGDITMAFTKTWPPQGETVASASSKVATIRVYAGHDVGSPQSLSDARLEIAFLGALDPSITWHD